MSKQEVSVEYGDYKFKLVRTEEVYKVTDQGEERIPDDGNTILRLTGHTLKSRQEYIKAYDKGDNWDEEAYQHQRAIKFGTEAIAATKSNAPPDVERLERNLAALGDRVEILEKEREALQQDNERLKADNQAKDQIIIGLKSDLEQARSQTADPEPQSFPQTEPPTEKAVARGIREPEDELEPIVVDREVVERWPDENPGWRERAAEWITMRRPRAYWEARRTEVLEREDRGGYLYGVIAVGALIAMIALKSKGYEVFPDSQLDEQTRDFLERDVNNNNVPDFIDDQEKIIENQETIIDNQEELKNSVADLKETMTDQHAHAHAHELRALDHIQEQNQDLLEKSAGNLDGFDGRRHFESLEFRGDTIWSEVEKNLRQELGHQPTTTQIHQATQHVLNINNLSWDGARHLPVGYSYKMPNNLTAVINR